MELELKKLIQASYSYLIKQTERINSYELANRIVLNYDVNTARTNLIVNTLYNYPNLFWERN